MLLRPLLDISFAGLVDVQHLGQARKREVGAGEVHEDEPSGDQIGEVVEEVGVGDAIDCGADGEEEHEDISDVAESDHLSAMEHQVSMRTDGYN